ncbi:membrane protein [Ureibacillus sinduriensis BLB-1 = JCM 15800]|uniref:Membrane protein n=1 Tax=Ureibacillus sinduriensis BLB-1 = JCM 15800 TaxID=1384057 RepID=A0A0A3HXQ3_9BACL|nr:membrane protein [Ureibacillus sinduriensis BLB-1 = JCM 15800]
MPTVLLLGILFLISVPLLMKSTSLTLPSSLPQLNTIFLSILIEAIPFVLIGVLIAGFIQIFITEDHIRAWIPKNKFLAVVMSCVVGAAFPACECGIVPIVRRLIGKGVPLYAGVGFLLTGPLINPIVILSTYMAFGNDMEMALLRMGVGFVAALVIALIISILFKSNQLKKDKGISHSERKGNKKQPFVTRIREMLNHSIDEFFDMSKYLIAGAFVAAFLQTYVSTQSLLQLGNSQFQSAFVMMALAFVLSLCSEADAFIGASFKNVFPTTSILAFLVYGPMIDLKNMIMLLSVFKAKFVFVLFILITCIVFIFVNLSSLL